MTIYRTKPKQTFLIEKLLKESRWSKSELARSMEVTPRAIENFLNKWARTIGKQIQYTEAYNKCFETNYSYKELFNLVDKN